MIGTQIEGSQRGGVPSYFESARKLAHALRTHAVPAQAHLLDTLADAYGTGESCTSVVRGSSKFQREHLKLIGRQSCGERH